MDFFLSFRAPQSAPALRPTVWPQSSSKPSTPGFHSLSPRCRRAHVSSLPDDASAILRPVVAKRPVLFRPRGFTPPRRFTPAHGLQTSLPAASRGSLSRNIACCSPKSAARSAAGLRGPGRTSRVVEVARGLLRRIGSRAVDAAAAWPEGQTICS